METLASMESQPLVRTCYIMKKCPCNIQIFKVVKNENFQKNFFDIFLFFASKPIPMYTPFSLYKSRVQGGTHYTDLLSSSSPNGLNKLDGAKYNEF